MEDPKHPKGEMLGGLCGCSQPKMLRSFPFGAARGWTPTSNLGQEPVKMKGRQGHLYLALHCSWEGCLGRFCLRQQPPASTQTQNSVITKVFFLVALCCSSPRSWIPNPQATTSREFFFPPRFHQGREDRHFSAATSEHLFPSVSVPSCLHLGLPLHLLP